jgi:HSP20 family protein
LLAGDVYCLAAAGCLQWILTKEATMSMVRWDPFQELSEMRERLNRLYGERRVEERGKPPLATWAPAVDIQETDKDYVIQADLPDVKKENIKVQLQDGVLTIEGVRKSEKDETGRTFHRIEREYGQFMRRFAVPTEIDAAKIVAEFKDGVLNVKMPKSAPATPKAIDVKVA